MELSFPAQTVMDLKLKSKVYRQIFYKKLSACAMIRKMKRGGAYFLYKGRFLFFIRLAPSDFQTVFATT